MHGMEAKLNINERTRDVYEYNPAYPKPPLIPLPDADDIDLLIREMNFKSAGITRILLKILLRMNGLRSYIKQLPQNLEKVLRTSDTRGGALNGLIVSATVALADDPAKSDYLDRAVSLILGARSLHEDISSGKLAADEFRGQVLEMGQYPNFFSTTQVIEGRQARIFKSSRSDLVTIIVHGHFFQISISGLEATQLRSALEEVVRLASVAGKDEPCISPGILTCASRPVQMRAFNLMRQDEENRRSLDLIRHSFLILALDTEDRPADAAEAAKLTHSANNQNRWFHHSLQLVVFANARVGAVCNFSTFLDGNIMMRGAAEIQRRAAAVVIEGSGRTPTLPEITELKWRVPKPALERARREIQRLLVDQPATYIIEDFGTDYFSRTKLDATATFVMALQMASRKITGRHIQITQFLTMSKFRCMSLATAVVTTDEVNRFVEYMDQRQPEKSYALELLQKANAAQAERSRQARKSMPFYEVYGYYLLSLGGFKRIVISMFTMAYLYLMRKLKLFNPQQREALISFPEIFPEVPILGRPGVRLPYVKYFGLHYQIFADRIGITYMPGLEWKTDNATLTREIEEALQRISDLT
jgi:hypothetical protein